MINHLVMMEKTKLNAKKNLTFLIFILIIDLVAFTCILPLFPNILESYAKSNPKVSLF